MELLSTRILAKGDVGLETREFGITGIAEYLDLIIYSPRDVIMRVPTYKHVKTVYINMKWSMFSVNYFIKKILPMLGSPVNLILAGADQTVPNNTDLRLGSAKVHPHIKNLGRHKYVNKLFIENLDSAVKAAEPIPLGIHPRLGFKHFENYREFEKIDITKPKKVTNFNVCRYDSIQWAERVYVQQLCNNVWQEFSISTDAELTYNNYLRKLSQYMFTVCVHGGGIDVNPKLWESLLVGTIPIIRVTTPYTDIYHQLDLPVVVVNDWSAGAINRKKLNIWKKKYYTYFTDNDKRKNMLEKLSMDYWISKFRSI